MVKVLSRDAVQRMTGRRSSTSVGITGGGGDAGGVSRAWVQENYVSKNFFNQLFTIHGTRTYIDEETEEEVTEDVVITPNTIADGEEYQLSNVEVIVGLWTQKFLSALGLNSGGGGGGGATALTELVDVTINNPQNGQALVYNSSTGKWINDTITPDLTDYATKTWVQQQGYLTSSALMGYATQSWVQQQGYLTSSALMGYATKTWVQQQGYLTSSALMGYATQSWVQQQGYLTSSALMGYATQSWVQQQGYLTSSALTGYATQEWVNQQGYLTGHQRVYGTFWGQSWSNGGTVSGDMTGVGTVKMTGHLYMHEGGTGIYLNSDGTGIDWHDDADSYVASLLAFTSSMVTAHQGLTIPVSKSLSIGDGVLTWDASNNAFKVEKRDGTAANFYTTGGVSALGMSAGVSQIDAMTFNSLTLRTKMTLRGSVNIATGTTSYMVRNADDSDCIYLMNNYTRSKINYMQYYYNQYDNVGLHGTDYNYSDSWSIDPDGCAHFRRVYLNSNTYIYTNGSDLLLTIGSTTYKLTKTAA